MVSEQHTMFRHGPDYGALCLLPATSRDALRDLSDENSLPTVHAIDMPPLRQFLQALSRLVTSEGCCATTVPCVLCQQGANCIDHWLSFCQLVHLTWSKVPSSSTGVAVDSGSLPVCAFALSQTMCSIYGNEPVKVHLKPFWRPF